EFRQVPAEELAMERAGQFDLVVLCDVLHHVPRGERGALMDTARMLVAPGGHVAVKDWIAGRDLPTVLSYLSDRFITGDRPRFFESQAEFADLVIGNSAEVVAEGWVRPKRNNRYLVAKRPA
ncbi:MAG TPA: class I SAM-dependent methyltransferase, partial [Acidimicrobiia bacterium]|nr:class I SAM-dependent methyltransferase [Acidimicrobiia bacterium]